MASKYFSSTETTNFARLSRLVVDVCSDVLRAVLRANIPPPGLNAILQSQRVHLCRYLEHRQQQSLYPPGGVYTGTLEDLDLTLLYKLIRNLQGINIVPHVKGWGRRPDNIDRSLAANIDRLRIQRNEAYGHLRRASLSDTDFHRIWGIIRQCISEIEQGSLTGDTYVTAVDNLLTVTMDPDTENEYIGKLRKQQDKFEAIVEDVKRAVVNVESHQKSMAFDIGLLKAGQETMETDISDVTATQETITTSITEVITRQETMATVINDVSVKQEENARDLLSIKGEVTNVRDALNTTTASTKDIHPDLVPMIERAKCRIKQEKAEKKFFETQAFRDAQGKLQKNRVLVIKGNTGDGKTSTAIQLLHWLIEEQPCRQPLQLHNIKKLDLLAPNSHLITFIDDIFGEKDVGRNDVQAWNKRIADVKTLFVDEHIHPNFLLITIRNEIYNALEKCSFGDVFCKDNIIDLSSDEYNIGKEKRELLEMYKPEYSSFSWTEEEKDTIVTCAPNIGFPQCCQLFYNSVELQKRRVDFFEKPFQFLIETLSKLPECSAILFLFLNNGMIMAKDLDPNGDKVNKTLLEQAFKIDSIGGKQRTTIDYEEKVEFVKESLNKLSGFLVRKGKDWFGDEVYKFDHDSISVTVALLYGGKTPIGYIENCPRKFLSYLTTSKTSSNMVVLSSDNYTFLCERLLREIESVEWNYDTGIANLDVWKDSAFVEEFDRLMTKREVNKLVVLNRACFIGAKECVLYLLGEGVEPDENTPWWSLIGGEEDGREDVDALKKVIRYLNDDIKLDLLNEACDSGSVECALCLLDEGVKPDKGTNCWSLITRGDEYSQVDADSTDDWDVFKNVVEYLNDERKLYLLDKACCSGSVEHALYLLCEGAKPEKDTAWWSLITRGTAVSKGDTEVLREVFIYLDDAMKLDLFTAACCTGSVECALYLLCEGVKPVNNTLWWSLIARGFQRGTGDVTILQKVVTHLNDEIKLYLFHEACYTGSRKCALYLLSAGVRPDKDALWSLLKECKFRGERDVDVLQKVFIYLHVEIKRDLLNEACRSGLVECALYLLCEGVKLEMGTTSWSLITIGNKHKKGNVDVLRKVVKYLNDEMKLDLFTAACRSGSVECAIYLLCEGVKPVNYTLWWSLITSGKWRSKGDVSILKEVIIHMNDEIKLDLFHKTCYSGSEECSLYLLSAGVKPDKCALWSLLTRCKWRGKRDVDVLQNVFMYLNDEIKRSFLNKACESGSEECALYLLCEGVKPDKDTPWWSLITKGVEDGEADLDVLQKVVVYLNDEIKLDLFNVACCAGSVECALFLLVKGVKPDKDTDWWSLVTRFEWRCKGDVDVLKKVVIYLNGEIKLNLFNSACRTGSEECALYLLYEGVKPDKDTQWWSLITSGERSSKGDVSILKKVITHLNDEMKIDLVNIACRSGSEECALYLMCDGFKPDMDTLWSLITASRCRGRKEVDVLKTVITHLNDAMKRNLLNKACDSGSEECALYLLCEGVKPTMDTQLWCLFAKWRGKGDVRILQKLVRYMNDEIKLDLLDNACESGSEDCALYLLFEGVNPDMYTPLWSLITDGDVNSIGNVDILKKVVVYLNDEMKLLLYNKACRSGSVECALYLLREGVTPDENTDWWSLITKGERSGKGHVDVLKKVVIHLSDDIKLDLINKACHSGAVNCALYLLCLVVKPDQNTDWWSLITRGVSCDKGDVDVLKEIHVYLNGEMELDLLNQACRLGSEDCALYLLYKGVKPDQNTDWWSLITRGVSCDQGDVDVLKEIHVYLNGEMELDLLNQACRFGLEECALYLLCKGVKPDKNTPLWSLITKGDENGEGDVDVLKDIIIYLKNEMKNDLFNQACRSGSEECALYLLSEGVKPDNHTPWWSLITRGERYSRGDVDLLKEINSYLDEVMKRNLFNDACRSISTDCALYLLNGGVKPDKDTPWWSLITRGDEDDGVDVGVLEKVVIYLSDEIKLDLLHKACWHGSDECVFYLLCVGVQPDKYTPWWSLITGGGIYSEGDVDVLKEIILYLDDDIKLYLLDKACRSGSEECVLYLLCKGVQPDKDTPLWSLIIRGDEDYEGDVGVLEEVVKYLSDEIKLELFNKACWHGSKECSLYLLSAGVQPDKYTSWWSLITGGVRESEGDVNVLKEIIIYLKDKTKLYLLNKACRSGSVECALFLLHEGVNPDKNTPLWPFITGGEEDGVADIDVLQEIVTYLNDEMKLDLLNEACWHGSKECVFYLLGVGVQPDKCTPWWSLMSGDVSDGEGDVNVLKEIILYLDDQMKHDLLNEACDSGSEECALYLLTEGVKPDKYTSWWSLVTRGEWSGKGDVNVLKKVIIYLNDGMKLILLNKSCNSGSVTCSLFLLFEGVKPDKDTPWWSLITRGNELRGKGDVDVLKEVIIYLNDKVKRRLLNKACHSGSEECALYLLCEAVEPEKDTPWWSLITRGNAICGKGDVDVLNKVVIYMNDEIKRRLLNQACASGSENCALYLLYEGVEPDAHTYFHAVRRGSVNVLRKLIQWGIPPTARYEDNNNALHEACGWRSEEMVTLLCDNYPNLVKDTNDLGQTPLHFVAEIGSLSMFQVVERTILKSLCRVEDEQHKCETEDGRVVHRSCVCSQYMSQLVDVNEHTVLHWSLRLGNRDTFMYVCESYPALATAVDKDQVDCATYAMYERTHGYSF
ncbi:uncharacterized protein LOC117326809 [Pecten maximus]|uniref:uncharacterized protein LOC117326809 n=1 Tax=Pecten maximus TaxID=6579 RepID=UPI001458C64B|nr:uncharacterized protein LOC117326809 [Pecten maximus]